MFYLHLNVVTEKNVVENHYMELDDERWQVKNLVLTSNQEVFYAYDNIEKGIFLSEAQYPLPIEVNYDDKCEGAYLEEISKSAFYEQWNKYINN